jgi:phosphoglycolate phosphatase-like HAD superfamily hydrolase
MALDSLLTDLARYWQLKVGTNEFRERLASLANRYPRVFDVVEERIFVQLFKHLKPAKSGQMTAADVSEWITELEPIFLDAEEKKKLAKREEPEPNIREIPRTILRESAPRKPRPVAVEPVVKPAQFDLLLLDLDGTLLNSVHLEQYRGVEHVGIQGKEYLDALAREARKVTQLIPEQQILQIIRLCPKLKLGVLTRSPRSYAETLLDICYPLVRWDCVVAYDDVQGKVKPHPSGVMLAMSMVGVNDFSRTALVGDGKDDILSALQAGTYAVLYRSGWGTGWKTDADKKRKADRYWALELVPDAIVDQSSRLVSLLTEPVQLLPSLESWDAMSSTDWNSASMRVDARNHFNNLESSDHVHNWVTTSTLGRYFASHQDQSRFDFRRKAHGHSLTAAILAAKDGAEYPQAWIACISKHIETVLNDKLWDDDSLIVCPIPARPGRQRRMERFIERIAEYMGARNRLTFDTQLLQYKAGVQSNKDLNQRARFINVRDNLEVNPATRPAGFDVMVIDDVVTSGATFFYAERYLRAVGANRVHCYALTQTIS